MAKLLKKNLNFVFMFALALIAFAGFCFKDIDIKKTYAEGGVARIGTTLFSSLQDAINNAPATQTSIVVLSNIEATTKITIPEGKNILLTNEVDVSISKINDGSKFVLFEIENGSSLTLQPVEGTTIFVDGKNDNEFKVSDDDNIHLISNSGILNLQKGVILQNNKSYVGGAIYNNGSGVITINGATIQNCYAFSSGGAIYNDGTLIINNGLFQDNVGGAYGGFVINKGELTINNGNFFNNKAVGSTHTINYDFFGGVVGNFGGNLTINDGIFSGNIAYKESIESEISILSVNGVGSVVGINGGSCIINGGTYKLGIATYGGAIGLKTGTLIVEAGTFENNKAVCGGAIYSVGGKASISNVTIKGNTSVGAAMGNGGGVYVSLKYSPSTEFKIFSSKIENNISESNLGHEIFWDIKDEVLGSGRYLVDTEISNELKFRNNIYAKTSLTIGSKFSVGAGNQIYLMIRNIIYVTGKLSGKNPIGLLPSSTVDTQIFPVTFVKYASKSDLDASKFDFALNGYSLVPTALGDGLQTARSVTIKFWQYKNLDGFQMLLSTEKVLYGESITPPEQGTRDGYQWQRWSREANNVTEDLDIYGIWGKQITVSFKIYDDLTSDWRLLSTFDMVSGNSINSEDLPTIPQRNGYTRRPAQWNYTPGELIDAECDIFAIYYPDELTITFNFFDKSFTQVIVLYGETLKPEDIPLLPEVTGYTQNVPYWQFGFDIEGPILENKSVDCVYTLNVYEVVFKFLDETTQTVIVGHGEKVDPLVLPKIEGFTIKDPYWNFDFDTLIIEDTEIQSVYTPNVYKIKFYADSTLLVEYSLNHNESLVSKYGDEIFETTQALIPEKDGYTQTKPVFNIDFSTAFNRDVTVTAVYTINSYTIILIRPDNSRIYQTIEHGRDVDTKSLIDLNFGEAMFFNGKTKNITESGIVYIAVVNIFMWVMIGIGILILILITVIVIRILIKKRRENQASSTRTGKRKVGIYLDDNF